MNACLDAAAVEVNQVWNWARATSEKAARPFAGPAKYLSNYDLDRLSAGATEFFEHIGADTIQKVNAEFVSRVGGSSANQGAVAGESGFETLVRLESTRTASPPRQTPS